MTEHGQSYRTHLSGNGVRRTVHNGRDTLVVPVVMIVEGVLNGALLSREEFGKFPQSWDGRPVPVLHPQRDGEPVHANQPDIVEKRVIGHLYNTHVEGEKLKSEAWIDVEQAKERGFSDLITALEAGETLEVSTGYFADGLEQNGEHNGKKYNRVDTNIRPDHLALLPGEIGACSVADGCGTRVNKRETFMTQAQQAFNQLAQALGLRNNCQCGSDDDMTQAQKLDQLATKLQKENVVTQKQADTIRTHAKLSPDQIEMLMELDAEQLKMVAALTESLTAGDMGETPEPDNEGDMGEGTNEKDEYAAMSNNSSDIRAMVDEQVRRYRVLDALRSNSANPFSEKVMATMSVEALEQAEQSIRPTDYSGQGGYASNGEPVTNNVQPLEPPKGILAKKH